jgi:hypothetical protein
MDASCQKSLPLQPLRVDTPQPVDRLNEPSTQIFILEKEYLELKSTVGYWRSMHGKAILREKILQQTIKELKGQIRDLRHRIFGKKSGKPYISHEDGEKESIRYIVNVKAHVRIYNRQCMKKGCCCKGVADKLTAPIPANVIPKSPYDISIWEAVLLTKFHYCQPTNRLLNQYAELGLPISPGTIAGGLKTLKKMFQPIYEALYNHQMTEDRFHNDESSWKVFETVDNKIGNRWWLWVSRSVSVVYFQIAPGRGADVPVEYFKNTQQQKIIVICDRYSAYKSLARQMPFIVLAPRTNIGCSYTDPVSTLPIYFSLPSGSEGYFLCSRIIKPAPEFAIPQVKLTTQKLRSATQTSFFSMVKRTFFNKERSWA